MDVFISSVDKSSIKKYTEAICNALKSVGITFSDNVPVTFNYYDVFVSFLKSGESVMFSIGAPDISDVKVLIGIFATNIDTGKEIAKVIVDDVMRNQSLDAQVSDRINVYRVGKDELEKLLYRAVDMVKNRQTEYKEVRQVTHSLIDNNKDELQRDTSISIFGHGSNIIRVFEYFGARELLKKAKTENPYTTSDEQMYLY